MLSIFWGYKEDSYKWRKAKTFGVLMLSKYKTKNA